MRNLLPVLFVCLSALARSQDQPVSWTAGLERAGENSWTLFIKATIENGWWLYADNSKANVGGPHIIIESGNCGPREPLLGITAPKVITDPILGPSIRIFRTETLFSQSFFVSGESPQIILIIEGFASDAKTFLPIRQQIKIAGPQMIPAVYNSIIQPANNQIIARKPTFISL